MFKSRKFKLTLAAIIAAAAGAISGEMTWETAIMTAVAAIASNVIGIAIEGKPSK